MARPRPSLCRCKTSQNTTSVISPLWELSHIPFCFFQYPMDKNKGVKIPVQLRINMWLGLSAQEKKFNSFSEGNFSVYAEMVMNLLALLRLIWCWVLISTLCERLLPNIIAFHLQYENQAHVLGKWGTTGLVGRHKFSDVTGKVKLKQERFLPPRGWEWEGDWFVDPERWQVSEMHFITLTQLFIAYDFTISRAYFLLPWSNGACIF